MAGWVGRIVAVGILLLACHCAQSDSSDTPATDATPVPGSSPAVVHPVPETAPITQAETLPALLKELAGHYADSSRCPLPRSGLDEDPCLLWAVQQMLTTTSASNGAVGGAFRIPYFWHWIEPNPRLSIIRLPEEIPLGELPPPTRYGRYQSFGYIDRTPVLYLSDLVADAARYRHPSVGEFLTFGWCSEREMALCSLLTTWGFTAKVHQSGIHVTTRVWLNGEPRSKELVLDTTFDSVRLREVDRLEFETWSSDLGEGESVAFYNRVCRDAERHQQLRALPVSTTARERLARQAEHYFDGL